MGKSVTTELTHDSIVSLNVDLNIFSQLGWVIIGLDSFMDLKMHIYLKGFLRDYISFNDKDKPICGFEIFNIEYPINIIKPFKYNCIFYIMQSIFFLLSLLEKP